MNARSLRQYLMARTLRCGAALVLALSFVASPTPSHAADPNLYPQRLKRQTTKPPWLRRSLKPKSHTASGEGLMDLTKWPAEPPSPSSIDAERFKAALKLECAYMPPKRNQLWTDWILADSATFGVDPFTVAAIVTERGACAPGLKNKRGIGLSGLQVNTHAGYIKKRIYTYWTWEKAAARWQKRTLPLKRHLYYERALELPKSAIYFAAAILKVAKDQCPGIDAAWGSVPHRHHVSHVSWGDRVRGAGDEDRILAARRRLLIYYGAGNPEPRTGRWRNLALRSPLDGYPRTLTSIWGEPRAGGKRSHQGVDFASTRGEPVRAIAEGKVFLAGVNLKSGETKSMPLDKAKAISSKKYGAAGFLVKIKHPGGLVSAYMHLDEYTVKPGDTVQAGDFIGRVGRTGIRESNAHLHFELRHDGKRIDPLPHLRPLIIHPEDTWRGHRLAYEVKRKKRRRRRK